MKHRRSQVKSLLAGRCRVARTAPPAATAPCANELRVTHGTRAPASALGDAGDRTADAEQRWGDTASAANAALLQLEQMLFLLHDCLRCMTEYDHAAVRPARCSAADQRHIDDLIGAFEALAHERLCDGAVDLASGVRLMLDATAIDGPVLLDLAPVCAGCLGCDELGGNLATLRAGEANAPAAFGIGPARAIVRAAILQIETHRERVQRFVDGPLHCARAALDVAAGNVAAAHALLEDDAFPAAAARLTPLDALAVSQSGAATKRPDVSPARCMLRLRRPPRSDHHHD